MVSLKDIKRVHPAVCRKLQERCPESPVGLEEVSDELINDIFAFPRIAVVPIPGEPGYWCWIGVRVFQRLVNRGWNGKVAVLDFGTRMPEEDIVDRALKDWDYWPAIEGISAKSDRAIAQKWEAATNYACRPATSGRRRRSGRKVYTSLRGVELRTPSADMNIKAAESADDSESAAGDGDEQEGTKN